MRSRYAAYALGETGYVVRTWHPRTRPDDLSPDPGVRWTGLEVVAAPAPDGTVGEVEFRASYSRNGQPGVRAERSIFERRRGRWVYVEEAGD